MELYKIKLWKQTNRAALLFVGSFLLQLICSHSSQPHRNEPNHQHLLVESLDIGIRKSDHDHKRMKLRSENAFYKNGNIGYVTIRNMPYNGDSDDGQDDDEDTIEINRNSDFTRARYKNKNVLTNTNIRENSWNDLTWNDDICNDVVCDQDEYCVKPEIDVAICVKKEGKKNEQVDNEYKNVEPSKEENDFYYENRNDDKDYYNDDYIEYYNYDDNDDDDDDDDDDDEDDNDEDDGVVGKQINNKSKLFKYVYNKKVIPDISRQLKEVSNHSIRMRVKNVNTQKRKTNRRIKLKKSNVNMVKKRSKQIGKDCRQCTYSEGQTICATDNRTYTSTCMMELYNCNTNSDVQFVCFGVCPCMRVFEKVLIKPPNESNPIKDQTKERDSRFVKIKQNKKPILKTRFDKKQFKVVQSTECTIEQRRAMGLRLLNWFSVVMNEELKFNRNSKLQQMHQLSLSTPNEIESNELPECELQVSFMFTHFDTDRDRRLSINELYYLVHDENEHCIEPYLTQCDDNEDQYLTFAEWCSCFSMKGKCWNNFFLFFSFTIDLTIKCELN